MDAILLSRVQFGLTAFFHFLFPPLSIGMATIIAIMEFLFWKTGKKVYDEMARFWFKLFAATFVVGVATGITMEFQFGTNWSEYSKFVGDIFGAPLAAEGVFAFFLESTFFGLLLFGRDKIGRTMRFTASLMVALGSTLSAFWIIVANSWMQTPAAYKIEGGRAVLTDFLGAVFNPSTLPRYLHVLVACYITGAFFILGISAYLLLKKKSLDIAKPSFKLALIIAFIAVIAQGFMGDFHAKQVAATQPAKLAAYEGLWETQTHAPLALFGIPSASAEKTYLQIGIPGLLSFLADGSTNSEIKGLKEFPAEERPPLGITYWSYRLMLIGAAWLVILALWGGFLLLKGRLYDNRVFLKAALYSMLCPLLINELGWMAAEVGRQPWIVFGVLKTQVAASPLPAFQILLTILLFTAVYLALGAVLVFLIKREVKKAVGEDTTVPGGVIPGVSISK